MSKLDHSTLIQYFQQYQELNKTEQIITDRITDILNIICKAFGCELTTWTFFDASYDTITNEIIDFGDLLKVLNDPCETITIDLGRSNYKNMTIIDKNGNKCDLSIGFPKRWLTEDFEEELFDGQVLLQNEYFRKSQERKQKLASAKPGSTPMVIPC